MLEKVSIDIPRIVFENALTLSEFKTIKEASPWLEAVTYSQFIDHIMYRFTTDSLKDKCVDEYVNHFVEVYLENDKDAETEYDDEKVTAFKEARGI